MRITVLLIVLVGLAAACAAPQVQTSGTPTRALGSFRSYALEQAVSRAGPAGEADGSVSEGVEMQISRALDARGLHRVQQEDDPDLLVRYWLQSMNPERERSPYQHYYETGDGAPYSDLPERLLAVEMVPAGSGEAMWRARIAGLPAPSAARLARAVQAGLAQALASLPGQ